MEHTKGKWEVITANGAVCVEGGNPREFVLDILDSNPKMPRKKHLANARLIAAAPDLLIACKSIEKYIKLLHQHWAEGDVKTLKNGTGVVSADDLDAMAELAFNNALQAIAKATKQGTSDGLLEGQTYTRDGRAVN